MTTAPGSAAGAGADGSPGGETTWSDLLTTLISGTDLSAEHSAWAMDRVMSGTATDAQLAGFLVALAAKGESVAELRGIADTMLAHAKRWEPGREALDIVGTGGDRSHTVNISTMACVVAAAAGVPVVKHGNRAASSASGSADVLEALGVRLDLDPASVQQVFAQVGITFCFAQTFHPAFRHAATVRRDLAVATAFNVLGPLTNPAQPRFAAVGVANPAMAPLVAGVFAERGRHAVVFRGDDGLDELTPATTSTVWWVTPDQVREFRLDPARIGVPRHQVEDLRGADARHNAGVTRALLSGEPGPVRDVVLLNTGLALASVEAGRAGQVPVDQDDLDARIAAGMARAAAAVDDGRAAGLLQRWAEVSGAR